MSDHPQRIDREEEQAARLTAFVLGELSDAEQRQVESGLNASLREECDEIERVSVALSKSNRAAMLVEPSAKLREAIVSKLSGGALMVELNEPAREHRPRERWLIVLSSGLLLLLLAAIAVSNSLTGDISRSVTMKSEIATLEQTNETLRAAVKRMNDEIAQVRTTRGDAREDFEVRDEALGELVAAVKSGPRHAELTESLRGQRQKDRNEAFRDVDAARAYQQAVAGPEQATAHLGKVISEAEATPLTTLQPTTTYTLPSNTPHSYASPPVPIYVAEAEVSRGGRTLGAWDVPAPNQLAAGPNARGAGTAVYNYGRTVQNRSVAEPLTQYRRQELTVAAEESKAVRDLAEFGVSRFSVLGAEQYSQIIENRFLSVTDQPLSTFSIDVDTASYANARRFLTQNQFPPANAIRIEEFINYFTYDYPEPKEGEPFSVNIELAECPWQPAHQLVRIGLKGKNVPQEKRPASNVVFLLDVSGSMQNANKLPLLKQAMKLLTDQLTEGDCVSIVTYAGNAGLALDATDGESKQTIRDAIDALNANGSTNGSAGIQLAYEKATEAFIEGGANRVILATDGDLNVGVTDDDALVKLITEKAGSGVFLTVLGFGEGNLKDGKLEKLADNGNGMYAYIDSLREARKVLVEQLTGSLVTIAKDVKIKVEFNPAEVAAYRLLGYENRLMSAPDFDNDAKDAGEIGAGHAVTALYEVVPSKVKEQFTTTAASLKYQQPATPTEPPKELTAAAKTGELLTLFLRYKQPAANESTLSEFTVANEQRAFDDASPDFRFAAAVASFGMVLRNSEFQGNSSLTGVEEIASSAIGSDPQGHRTEFLDLVRKASTLQPPRR